MKYCRLISILILLFSVVRLPAQNAYLDSLKDVLKRVDNDEDRYYTMAQMAGELTFSDPQKAIKYAKEVKKYYIKIKDYDKLTRIINNLGISYAISGDYDKSEIEFLEWLKIGTELKDSLNIAEASVSLGNVYHSKSNYNKAEAFYLRSLRIFEELDNKKGLSTVYTNLGNIYKAKGNYKKALDLFIKALKVAELYKQNKGTALTNIGDVFSDMGNTEKAIEYFEKSIEVFTEEGKPYYIAWSHSNLASVYFEIKDYKKAEELYRKAAKMHEEQNDPEGIAMSFKAIGSIRFEQKKYDEARENYKKAGSLYKEIDLYFFYARALIDLAALEMEVKNYSLASEYLNEAFSFIDYFPYDHDRANLFNSLSEVNKFLGNFKDALDFKEEAEKVKDSIFKGELTKSFAEKEAKYQNEKKQKENEILKQQNKINELHAQKTDEENKRIQEKTNLLIWFAVIGALLLSVIIIVLIRSNRLKQNTNLLLRDQNVEITRQKEIIEIKNKDITDSINYAQKIQQAILPDENTIKNILGESFILFLPRDIVSGDFYWMHKSEKGDIYFSVADCTGHGVPGAFMSMMGIDMLNKIVVDHGINEPGQILTQLNNEVKNALAKNVKADNMNDGMDIIVCKINSARTELQYASAMRSFYYVQNNQLTELKGDKTSIGGNTELNYLFESNSLKVEKDGHVYLTSDGFADQFGGAEGKKYMTKNLKELFIQANSKSMEGQLALLQEKFKKWKGSYEQIDDVTVMGVRI